MITLVALVTIAVIQKQTKNQSHQKKTNKEITLLTGIDLNTITGIEVQEGSNSVSLTKKDGTWSVVSLYNYPADFRKLADAVQSCSQVKTDTVIRSKNISAAEFGLDNTAKHISMKSNNKEILAINVGKSRDASKTTGWSNQHFINKSGLDSIFLVDYNFRQFTANSADWIKKDILNITSSDIVAVETGDIKLQLKGSDWILPDLNKQEELKSEEASKLRSALQYLNCITIANPTAPNVELGFDNPMVYKAETKDGFTYTIALGKKTDQGRYARLSATYKKPAKPIAPGKDADDSKKETYEKELNEYNTATANNENKANEFKEIQSKWTYIIDNSKADTLLLTRDKLIQEKEPQKEVKQDT